MSYAKIHNLKQEDLASRVGIKQETLSLLENGRQEITGHYKQIFADFFKVDKEIFDEGSNTVINHNIGTNSQSKSVHNPQVYNEFNKDSFEIITQKLDSLFIQLQQEREAVNAERKQLLELMSKLIK